MFEYDVAVYSYGALLDNLRVNADNSLEACNLAQIIHDPDSEKPNLEYSAKRIVSNSHKTRYLVYFLLRDELLCENTVYDPSRKDSLLCLTS